MARLHPDIHLLIDHFWQKRYSTSFRYLSFYKTVPCSHTNVRTVRPFGMNLTNDFMVEHFKLIECFHMTSRRPYWFLKTMKRRPCWCPKPVLWELNSFLMQTLSFVPINLHRCRPRERKHSIVKKYIHEVRFQRISIQGPLGTLMADFPTFYVLQRVKSPLFDVTEAWKRCLFQAEPPCVNLCREYSPRVLTSGGEDPLSKLCWHLACMAMRLARNNSSNNNNLYLYSLLLKNKLRQWKY